MSEPLVSPPPSVWAICGGTCRLFRCIRGLSVAAAVTEQVPLAPVLAG